MDVINIITEDIFTSFFTGLFKGRKGLAKRKRKKLAKTKKKLQKSIDTFNDGLNMVYSDINDERKESGLPAKKYKQLTMKNILDDIKNGKI